MASQGYRVRKPSYRRSGSLNYKSVTPGLKTKLDIFAHTFFSPLRRVVMGETEGTLISDAD